MTDHLSDLRAVLSQSLLGSPSASEAGGSLPEHQQIDRMVGAVGEHDVGGMSAMRMRTILKNNPVPNFDVDQWLTEKVAEGVYDGAVLSDTNEWDDDPLV